MFSDFIKQFITSLKFYEKEILFMAYVELGPKGSKHRVTAYGVEGMGPGRPLVILDAHRQVNENGSTSYNLTMHARNDVFNLDWQGGRYSFQADPNPQLISKPYGGLMFNPDGTTRTYNKMVDGKLEQVPKFREFTDFQIRSQEQLNFFNQYLPDGKTIQDFADKCDKYRAEKKANPALDAEFLRENAPVFNAPLTVNRNRRKQDGISSNIQILKVGDKVVTDATKLPYTEMGADGKEHNLSQKQTITFKYRMSNSSPVPDSPETKLSIDDYGQSIGLRPDIPGKELMKVMTKMDKNNQDLKMLNSHERQLWEKSAAKRESWSKAAPNAQEFDLDKHNAATAWAAHQWVHYAKQDPERNREDHRKFGPAEASYMTFDTFYKEVWPKLQNDNQRDSRIKYQQEYQKAHGNSKKGLPWVAQIDTSKPIEERARQVSWIVAQQIGVKDLSAVKPGGLDYSKINPEELTPIEKPQTSSQESAVQTEEAVQAPSQDTEALKEALEAAQKGAQAELSLPPKATTVLSKRNLWDTLLFDDDADIPDELMDDQDIPL